MTTVLLGAIPFEGHVAPMLGVARRFTELDIRVRFLTGAAFADRVRATGAEFLPLPAEADQLESDVVRDIDERRLSGTAALRENLDRVFIRPAAAQYRALLAAIAEEPVDAVLTESGFSGSAGLLHTPGHPPVVVCGILPLGVGSRDVAPFGLGLAPDASPLGRIRNRVLAWAMQHVLFRENQRSADAAMREMTGHDMGGFFLDWPRYADAIAQFTVPSFEYPRSDGPAKLRFFGPVSRLAPSDHARPSWWHDLDGGTPVVHVTQGTVANENLGELIRPTLDALAEEDVLVVVSTGGKPVAELGELPANARAAEMLPYAELMPRVDVFVTNGGYGGLHYALERGVPIVVAGDTEDKPETAARVAWAGVGVNLRTGTPTASAIRDAVREVLADDRYARASARIGAEIQASSGVDGLADLIRSLSPRATLA
ncbi:nucleotide disphospho-sugar-binding domain-containing protein [Protaetiibacter larvae]|uniref:Glycosyltransferase n=1 Tax=Protaetiibacter larvae TaxID=2592654 RepID=A0A5C1Y7K7_9MICO|nr:nucleotide disphospho-sugar-binding domain-containing protein [Protaetiibacter larvae]QEO09821.1 glycosyltransferase [Protaetiibacter larvae]